MFGGVTCHLYLTFSSNMEKDISDSRAMIQYIESPHNLTGRAHQLVHAGDDSKLQKVLRLDAERLSGEKGFSYRRQFSPYRVAVTSASFPNRMSLLTLMKSLKPKEEEKRRTKLKFSRSIFSIERQWNSGTVFYIRIANGFQL